MRDRIPPNPAESPGFLVGRVAHYLRLDVQRFLDEAGIPMSAEAIAVLTLLAHHKGRNRLSELAHLLGRDISTLSRQIDGLAHDGLVQRDRDPEDGRAMLVCVTAAGNQLIERTAPLSLGLRRRAMSGISESDEEIVIRALKQMIVNLRDGE